MASKSKWKQPEWADSVLEDTGASFLHEKKRHLGKYNRKRNSKVSKRKSISHNKASNKSAVRSQTKTKSTATKHQKDKPDNIISDKKSQDASCQLNTQTQKSMMIKRRPLSIQTQQILSLLSNAIDANKTKKCIAVCLRFFHIIVTKMAMHETFMVRVFIRMVNTR